MDGFCWESLNPGPTCLKFPTSKKSCGISPGVGKNPTLKSKPVCAVRKDCRSFNERSYFVKVSKSLHRLAAAVLTFCGARVRCVCAPSVAGDDAVWPCSTGVMRIGCAREPEETIELQSEVPIWLARSLLFWETK